MYPNPVGYILSGRLGTPPPLPPALPPSLCCCRPSDKKQRVLFVRPRPPAEAPDPRSEGAYGNPFRSVAAALGAAGEGTELVLLGGVYPAVVVADPPPGLTLRAGAGERVVLRPPHGHRQATVVVIGARECRIEGLEIEGVRGGAASMEQSCPNTSGRGRSAGREGAGRGLVTSSVVCRRCLLPVYIEDTLGRW